MAKTHLILAAGHAPQQDPGAVNGHRTEAEEAIEIVNTAAVVLAKAGIPTSIVPHELNLRDQIKWVNARWQSAASIAIEVHKNAAGTPAADGVEVWYESGNMTERNFAADLSARLAGLTGKPNRGVFPDTQNRHKRLGWVHLKVDSVLVEAGFISSSSDLSATKYGRALGQALVLALGKATPPKPQEDDDNMMALDRHKTRRGIQFLGGVVGPMEGKKGYFFVNYAILGGPATVQVWLHRQGSPTPSEPYHKEYVNDSGQRGIAVTAGHVSEGQYRIQVTADKDVELIASAYQYRK